MELLVLVLLVFFAGYILGDRRPKDI